MTNLKPISFILETQRKESIISPSITPGCIIVYNSSHYVAIKQHEKETGWIMYCFDGKPEKRLEACPGGVMVPFGDELYTRPAYWPTNKSQALLKEIIYKITPELKNRIRGRK